MQPSEVRRRILDDHEKLRAMLTQLEATAAQVLTGEAQLLGSLRTEGTALLSTLREHMHWEDVYLRPALLAADAWGRERAERLDHDHEEQRELLGWAVESVEDQSRPAPVIARTMLDLVRLVREDMTDEERWLVNERVLRDDVVTIDCETG